MSAKTQTLSLTGRVGARSGAGPMAQVIGSIQELGVGIANSQTLHDAAQDTGHSCGFPGH